VVRRPLFAAMGQRPQTTDNGRIMSQTIRVVVVDDSALMRRMITNLIERDPAIRVVGAARDGREAITLVEELRPDIVTMDVRMPVMDGLATTEHLMAYCPTPILVLTASLASHEVDITFRMLDAGALEVIEKPHNTGPLALERAGYDLIRRIKMLARVKVVTHLRGRRKPGDRSAAQLSHDKSRPAEAAGSSHPAATVLPDKARSAARSRTSSPNGARPIDQPAGQAGPVVSRPDFPLIVIGASTGGPRVVHQILRDLPRDLGAAVMVVQHIAAGFSVGMAEWLASASALPVYLAREGHGICAGEVLVAPDQRDLMITTAGTVHLNENPLLIQRPAIDVTMQAAAEVFGPQAIGVLLTGMGRDGAYGMLTIRRAGGYTIAQDEASSAIFGMPRAAIQLGAAAEVLPPPRIAARLVEVLADGVRPAQARKDEV
jgi:two-component system, chemotaxis family, protein-glutamate methylesterase/glutaminase